jgi:tetratricopeptide (TPR) repeat protein
MPLPVKRGTGGLSYHARIAVAAALMLLTGCDQLFQDKAARSLDTAQQKYNDGDYAGAVQYYEDALDGTAKTAEIHYKLALLFDDKLKNPLAAMYHFQRYLDLKPAGSNAKEAKSFIKEDEMKLITSFSQGALMSQQDAARLKNDNLSLRKQVAELRAMKNLPPLPGTPAVPPPVAGAPQTPAPGSRMYEVQPGDTLASISRKFYKSPARYKDIQDANYNTLKGTAKLKPGMSLIIPK